MSSQKHQSKLILLEIQVDRMNEKGVFIASQILNILHDSLEYHHFKKTIRPVFHFEIAAVGGKIRFFLLCDREYVSFITNQFYAQYPSIDIIERTDYIPEKLWYSQMELHHFTYDPIKIYTEFSEKTETDVVDPFSALTSALIPDSKRMEISNRLRMDVFIKIPLLYLYYLLILVYLPYYSIPMLYFVNNFDKFV